MAARPLLFAARISPPIPNRAAASFPRRLVCMTTWLPAVMVYPEVGTVPAIFVPVAPVMVVAVPFMVLVLFLLLLVLIAMFMFLLVVPMVVMFLRDSLLIAGVTMLTGLARARLSISACTPNGVACLIAAVSTRVISNLLHGPFHPFPSDCEGCSTLPCPSPQADPQAQWLNALARHWCAAERGTSQGRLCVLPRTAHRPRSRSRGPCAWPEEEANMPACELGAFTLEQLLHLTLVEVHRRAFAWRRIGGRPRRARIMSSSASSRA